MSAGLPYLQKLRKSDLTELAEASKLKDYGALRKVDLEAALDDHLQKYQGSYQTDPALNDYYKRLGVSPKKALVKTEVKRKKSEPSDETSLVTRVVAKTPSRSSLGLPARVPLPPSPAAVTDAIDRQTVKLRRRVSGLYSESGIHEGTEYFRDALSSPIAVSAAALALDGYLLRQHILPSVVAGVIPAIPFVTSKSFPVYVPNLFQLLEQSFWAPFSLWVLTSLLLPLLAAYFVNLPLKSINQTHGTRRAAALAATNQFDPLAFGIAKALLAYVVYAQHFGQFLFSATTVRTVNDNVLSGYQGTIVGAVILVTTSLYEAVLRK